MVIFHMNLEVFGEMLDPLAEKRDLHFRRAGVRLMNSELLYSLLLLRFSNPHILRSVSFLPFVYSTTNITIWCCKGSAEAAVFLNSAFARPTVSSLRDQKTVAVIATRPDIFSDVLSSSVGINVLDCMP